MVHLSAEGKRHRMTARESGSRRGWRLVHGTCSEHTREAAQGSSRASGRKEGEEEYPWGSRSEAWHQTEGVSSKSVGGGQERRDQVRQAGRSPVTHQDMTTAPASDRRPLCDPALPSRRLFVSFFRPRRLPAPATPSSWCFLVPTSCPLSLSVCDSLPPPSGF